jgi:acyl carrier protein
MSACTEVMNVENKIEHEVRFIVGSALSIDASHVPLQARLAADLGMDSLAAMDILHGLEDAFSFTIDGLNRPSLETLSDLVSLAKSHAPLPA